MANLSSDVSSKANGLSRDFETNYNKVMTAGERAADTAKDFAKRSEGYLRTSQKYVRENPTSGAAIALAAGAVIGAVVGMRMRKSSKV